MVKSAKMQKVIKTDIVLQWSKKKMKNIQVFLKERQIQYQYHHLVILVAMHAIF